MHQPNLESLRMKLFRAECEVWVKPLFRKSRPKLMTTMWSAENYEQFLRMLREHYEGKRWTLVRWSEEIVHSKGDFNEQSTH